MTSFTRGVGKGTSVWMCIFRSNHENSCSICLSYACMGDSYKFSLPKQKNFTYLFIVFWVFDVCLWLLEALNDNKRGVLFVFSLLPSLQHVASTFDKYMPVNAWLHLLGTHIFKNSFYMTMQFSIKMVIILWTSISS